MENKKLPFSFFFLPIVFLLFFSVQSGWAQPYPVTANVQLIGNTLPRFDASLVSNSNKIFYTLILNDNTESNYPVRLRMTVSGNGVTVKTSPDYAPPPIYLQYNVPLVLTATELAAYFDLDNLTFVGMTQQEYLTRGRLPEGAYSLCFEAYDYFREEIPPVSNRSCASTLIMLHDPPIITQPIGNQLNTQPLSMNIAWQPMHAGTFMTEYDLDIFEVLPGLTDDQVLNTTAPVFQTTTSLTTYQYGLVDPILLQDQDYIVRVRVRDPLREQYFENDGFGQHQHFMLVDPCQPGTSCDDGNPCTSNDVIDVACNCVGTMGPDADQDGVCDALDICAAGDDNIDLDNDGIPDACDECVINGPCDDGDPCTYDDSMQDDCTCMGKPSGDQDGDGICDSMDECILGPDHIDVDHDGIADACDDCVVGTPCDDGDPNTINDQLTWNPAYTEGEPLPNWVDACACKGVPGPCAGNDDDNDGVCNQDDLCPGFDDNEDMDFDGIPDGCDDRDDCDGTLSVVASLQAAEEKICNYCLEATISKSQSYKVLTGLRLRVPDGREVTLSGTIPGFNFPYCYGSGTCFGSGSDLDDLAVDLETWLTSEGYSGQVDFESSQTQFRLCTIQKSEGLAIRQSNVQFLKAYWIDEQTETIFADFKAQNCQQISTASYRLDAVLSPSCMGMTYQWSDGSTTSSIVVSAPLSAYAVTVSCSSGCSYVSDDPSCWVGVSCDDGSPCTENSVINELCQCIGSPVGDQDGDGACDPLDICPGGNDYLDFNQDGQPDDCYGCVPYHPCDDGNDCTVNDAYTVDCECVGSFVDTDQDGVCDANDQCPGHPDYLDLDMDGIPNGCDNLGCVGSGPTATCQLVQLYCACDSIDKIPLDVLSQMYLNNIYGNDNILDSLTLAEYGDTEINYEEVDLGGSPLLEVFDYYQIGYFDKQGNVQMADDDNDGVCNLLDMCPGGNDLIDLNNNCIPDACESNCTLDYSLQLQVMFDRDCDDGDPCTEFDQFDCNCNCVGVLVDSDG
ncbi:MAG: hypothetical protein AAF990_22350, partial [Bacteroidota bacterium]